VLHAWHLPSAAKKVLIEESTTYAPILREVQDIKDYLHSCAQHRLRCPAPSTQAARRPH